MCGIAGIISADAHQLGKDRLKKMTDAISHRGPDGEGSWIDASGRIGLGHRRLSIIDLSQQAAQPMHFKDRYTVIHNGEIYNYIELREELTKKGYVFRSQSDTEVILAAYDAFGAGCLGHFDGMFAFAIWDQIEQRLFCARDRFGEKPFYYAFSESQFAFASEAKALWAIGIEKKINEPLLLNYLVNGHAHTAADKTITFYQEIFSLPPSHFLQFKLPTFEFDLVQYWDGDKESQTDLTEERAVERVDELLSLSVTRRLRSDVPVGNSLSGGLDSSSIVAIIRASGENTSPLRAFSAVFPGFEKDESAYIRAITKRFHLESIQITPTADDLIKDFERLCYHQEIPFSSSSVFLQFKIFELAKQRGVKVLLDGQGADEIFAGYFRYIHWYLQELLRKNWALAGQQKKLLKRNGAFFEWGWKNYAAAYFPAQATVKLEKKEASKIRRHPDITDAFRGQFFDRQSIYKPFVTKLNDVLYFDTFGQGLDELLHYADRNSMAHGREVRLPYLYHELVQFAFSLPSRFKIRDGWTKYILRKSMEHKLPESVVWRKDKTGYEPPQKEWMRDKKMQDYLYEAKKVLVGEKILKPEVLNKKSRPLEAYAADNFDWRYLVAARFMKS